MFVVGVVTRVSNQPAPASSDDVVDIFEVIRRTYQARGKRRDEKRTRRRGENEEEKRDGERRREDEKRDEETRRE